MNPERERFLNLREKPARLLAEQVAHFLECSAHDIPILVAHGLLKPLGHPAENTVKHFATVAIRELMDDTKWLAKASDTIREHWRIKNARKSENNGQRSHSPDNISCDVLTIQQP
jgi:hypothetical protein